jgi:nucleoid-associated protein YgaU
MSSSIAATRTTRFAPPAPPTRKAGSRRTVVRQGSSVVCRVDRPVLRIVADDESAPVFTRVSPEVGLPSSVERPSSVELVETTPRRIDLDDFFAAEYDGDDQRLEVSPARQSTVRLTRRGRLVVLGLGLAATLGLGLYAASVSTANDHPEQTRTVTVQPGQTLWDISSRAAATTGSGDVRSMMSHLEAINHLDSASLQVGQHLRVPQ